MEEGKERAKLTEDATKYGEYVCSNYHWLPIEEQKKQAKQMENMTNQKKAKENKSK